MSRSNLTADLFAVPDYARNYFVRLYLESIFTSGYADLFLPLIRVCYEKVQDQRLSPFVYDVLLREIDTFIYYVFFAAEIKDSGIVEVVNKLTGWVEKEKGIEQKSKPCPIGRIMWLSSDISTELRMFRESIFSTTDIKDWFRSIPDWYEGRRVVLLRTFFEYEKWQTYGKNPEAVAGLKWDDVGNSAKLERISLSDVGKWRDNMGNILLTFDSESHSGLSYREKCFGEDESGNKVCEKCYANSPLIQEREMVEHKKWSSTEVIKRRTEIMFFCWCRWPFLH